MPFALRHQRDPLHGHSGDSGGWILLWLITPLTDLR